MQWIWYFNWYACCVTLVIWQLEIHFLNYGIMTVGSVQATELICSLCLLQNPYYSIPQPSLPTSYKYEDKFTTWTSYLQSLESNYNSCFLVWFIEEKKDIWLWQNSWPTRTEELIGKWEPEQAFLPFLIRYNASRDLKKNSKNQVENRRISPQVNNGRAFDFTCSFYSPEPMLVWLCNKAASRCPTLGARRLWFYLQLFQ